MKLRLLLLIIVGQCFTFCKNEQKEPEHKVAKSVQMLYDSTMLIHDNSMKEMARLEQYQRKISGFLRSFPANGDQPKEDGLELRKAMSEMNKGEEGMYRWMREFSNRLDTLPEVQQKTYLTIKRLEIQSVADQINAGLALGAHCYKKYGLENFKPAPTKQDTTVKK